MESLGASLSVDLYRSVGDMGKAYDHAALAVLSDPTYEHGWEAFREVANLLGLPWHRRVNNRGRVRLDEKNNPQIFLPPGTMDSPDASFWLGLGFIEAAELKKAVNNDREHDGLTPLERDRERVKKNLEFQKEWSTKNPPRRAPITDVFLSALETGFLDEAIFLHMIDARLASEFVKYREGSKARLLEYITRKVVPVISRPSN